MIVAGPINVVLFVDLYAYSNSPTGTLLHESMNHIYLNPCSIYQYITDMRVVLKGDVAMTKGAKE